MFVHQNFPGQFLRLSAELAKSPRNRVVALAIEGVPAPPGVEKRDYKILRQPVPGLDLLMTEQESKILRGEGCAAAALRLKHEGFVPDVIVAHSGWGEALFLRDVFPQAKIAVYCEYFYREHGQDVGFDPEDPPLNFRQQCRLRLRNASELVSLEAADLGLTPTRWQQSTYPAEWQRKLHVIHEGIDSAAVAYRPDAKVELGERNGRVTHRFQPGDEVLSFMARELDPVRGFQVFMRALPRVLARRPKAQVLVVGGDGAGYGRPAPGGKTWREHMLAEVGADLDLRRVHFLGKVPYPVFADMLSVTRLHSYWTTPFVLSWSFLEAGMSGAPLVGSATAPVEEFAPELGVPTLPFYDADAFADTMIAHLAAPQPMRRPPPKIKRLELKHCLNAQIKLLQSL
nr:glycosyltransferase [Massilia sp. TS11]